MKEQAEKEKFSISGISLIVLILFIISAGSCIRVMTSYEKVYAVAAKSEHYNGRTTRGTDLTVFEYTYNGNDRRHVIDTGTAFLYGEGSVAVLYCSPEDEKLLSDLLVMPLLLLALFICTLKM